MDRLQCLFIGSDFSSNVRDYEASAFHPHPLLQFVSCPLQRFDVSLDHVDLDLRGFVGFSQTRVVRLVFRKGGVAVINGMLVVHSCFGIMARDVGSVHTGIFYT